MNFAGGGGGALAVCYKDPHRAAGDYGFAHSGRHLPDICQHGEWHCERSATIRMQPDQLQALAKPAIHSSWVLTAVGN